MTADITLGDFTDDQGNTVSTTPGSVVNLQVDAYGGPQVIRSAITFGTSTTAGVPSTDANSRLFRQYVFSFNHLNSSLLVGQNIPPSQVFVVDNGNMADDEITPNALSTTTFNNITYNAHIRAFPGRFSTFTVRVDPNTIGLNFQDYPVGVGTFGAANPRGIFETTQFNFINFADTTDYESRVFNGVLSDYLSFDISAMATADKPSIASVVGQRVFFSGDTYGVADGTSSGKFYQLTKDLSATPPYLPGTFNTNTSIGTTYSLPSDSTSFLPGTYALDQIDPSDPSFAKRILSLQGMFRDYTKMIKSADNQLANTFPSSSDDNVQDIVLLKKSATTGKIIDFYYGYIDFEAREFFLNPINTIVQATPTTVYHGTINPTKLYNGAGQITNNERAIRSGVLALDTPLTFKDGTITTGGTFIVYRR